ncbi:MAG: single-stranded DNA-binding protein [Clostridia bacterium]|nr:single-stranded DNA-binding protein [Clostridia bacterium]
MLNKVVLMGRLTADPELRRTQSNTAVTSFTLAVNRTYSRAGEQSQTDFIDCVAWASTAEFVTKWFRKGMQIALCGRIQTRTWEDKQGQKRKSVEVIAEEVHFAEPKRDSQPRAEESQLPFDFGGGADEFSDMEEDDGELPF